MPSNSSTSGYHSDGQSAASLPALRLVTLWICGQARMLDPGYFALVMATGIISNAFFLEGGHTLSNALLAVNLAAYPWLWLLTLLRMTAFRTALWADLISPHRVFLFFTTVAATDVLAAALAMRGFSDIAHTMWLFALALWAALMYLGFAVLTFANTERADLIEGAWLNAIVGTQSLVILGEVLHWPAADMALVLLLHLLWFIGLALYGILIVLLCYRIFFFAVEPDDLAPPLWVIMGAAAISVNAGSLLAGGSGSQPLLALRPFVEAATLALWAWATWWIPLLLLLGLWKHGIHRRPLGYTPLLWSMVFPLGMYAAATFRLSGLALFPVLQSWSWIVAWSATAAWAATACGLVLASCRSGRRVFALAQWFNHLRKPISP